MNAHREGRCILVKKFDPRDVDFWVDVPQQDYWKIWREYLDSQSRALFHPGRKNDIVKLREEPKPFDRRVSEG
jgi:hypothetical protein